MAATLDVSCPNCGKQLKVPAELEGKRIKCKDCQEVFAITAPKKSAKPAPKAAPAKPAPKAAASKAAPPPPPPPPTSEANPDYHKSPFADDEDEGDGPAKPMGVIAEEDKPRCPECAKDLDPPNAVVCKYCGFNNKTRVKAEMKKVIASDATDWITHLGPGIIAAILAIGLIVVDIVCWVNMSSWLAGSALEKDEKNPVTGDTQYYLKPGAFTMAIIAISIFIIVPAGVFAVRRLIMNAKPAEKVKK